MRVLACATQGMESEDERRLQDLVSAFDVTVFRLDKRNRLASARRLLGLLQSGGYELFVLEGSGVAGGLSAILGRWLWRVPYVISSGDAVAPFLAARYPLGLLVFFLYENLLYANCSGFMGWTPYLVGRALSFGAPRAITLPGWAPFTAGTGDLEHSRVKIRRELGIPDTAVVFGIVGSLNWSKRFHYCYGAELVHAARQSASNAHVLIVGEGSGRAVLRQLAGEQLGKTIHLPGRIARADVPKFLAAMDVGSIPQTMDSVGAFRYTTKLAEYKAAGLPFISSQIPMSYDLDDGDIMRLPGSSPWDPRFLDALADLMSSLTLTDLRSDRTSAALLRDFNKKKQVARATSFLHDVVGS